MLLFNLHLHSAIADGVFLQKSANERPEFRALPAPEKGDVIALAWEVCEKTTRMLQKAGKYFDADPSEADKLAQEYPLLAACCADSLQGTVAIGARAGQRVLRSGEYIEHGENGNIEQVRTLDHGFNLHAGMRVSASDKEGPGTHDALHPAPADRDKASHVGQGREGDLLVERGVGRRLEVFYL